MSISGLVFRELNHNRINGLLGVMSLAVVSGGIVVAANLLYADYRESIRQDVEQSATLDSLMEAMKAEYRAITGRMGPTIRILAGEEGVADFYANGFGSGVLDQAVIDTIRTVFSGELRFALPLLRRKIEWERLRRPVLVSAAGAPVAGAMPRGGVPAVPELKPPELRLGYELHAALDIKQGDRVELAGNSFTVTSTASQSGSIDDITVWMSIQDARSMFGGGGGWSELWLWPDIEAVQGPAGDLARRLSVIPGCRAVESGAASLMQARAGNTAAAMAKEALLRERKHQRDLLSGKVVKCSIISALLVAAVLLWISFLTAQNGLARRGEIALWHALGMPRRRIASLVVFRAATLGGIGVFAGLFIGLLVCAAVKPSAFQPLPAGLAFAAGLAVVAIIAALSAVPAAQSAGRARVGAILSGGNG